eukprot:TRINITY_DN17722_c0_g1_i1.p1 TRINITY_DN17722_c0_g1~~TRINITY_DN17722_c0_g1_i1.p1  ORF type:complete len:305 (+),score=62.18 TRINITY_DN17722_c0_g1_i1:76-990(+)
MFCLFFRFFFNDTATTEIYTLHIVGSVRCVQETAQNTSDLSIEKNLFVGLSESEYKYRKQQKKIQANKDSFNQSQKIGTILKQYCCNSKFKYNNQFGIRPYVDQNFSRRITYKNLRSCSQQSNNVSFQGNQSILIDNMSLNKLKPKELSNINLSKNNLINNESRINYATTNGNLFSIFKQLNWLNILDAKQYESQLNSKARRLSATTLDKPNEFEEKDYQFLRFNNGDEITKQKSTFPLNSNIAQIQNSIDSGNNPMLPFQRADGYQYLMKQRYKSFHNYQNIRAKQGKLFQKYQKFNSKQKIY